MGSSVVAPVYCEASFNYAGTAGSVALTQPVLDGRAAALPAFDSCGFTLISHASEAVTDWTSLAAIDGPGADEFAALARSFTGADAVAVIPSILRNPAAAARVADHAPILFVHSDYTTDYLPMVTSPERPYQRFLGPTLDRYGLSIDDLRAASRVMVLQLWRNVGPLRPDHPLAFCDAGDVASADRLFPILVPEYGGERLEFQAYAFLPPAAGEVDHWYTFPSLSSDEAVLLRTYDSLCAAEGRPFWTPHSAFRDPGVSSGPDTQRASVEMRAICIWR